MSTVATSRLRWYGASLLLLTAIALAIRLVAGFAQHAMVPEYAAYYTTVAEQVAGGHGLSLPYAWSYLTPAVANGLALPRPAFEVWLPAASLLEVPLVGLLGGDAASRVIGALTGTALVPLVALLARRMSLAKRRSEREADVVALIAASLVAISLPFITGSISSDSEALFGVTTLAGVLAVDRALGSGRGRDLALAGVILGLGLLTRNETAILLGAAIVAAAAATGLPGRERLRRAALLGGIAVACYVPWALRQWLVFGTPIPSQTAANAFSIGTNDIFGWSAPLPSLATYLTAGPAALITQRITALGHNLLDVAVIPALPWSLVGLVGAALLWRSRPLRLLIATAVVVFAIDTLVFPVATLNGTFLHGSAPVLALLAIGAAWAAVRAVEAAARFAAARDLAAGAAFITVIALLTITSINVVGYARWANAVPVRYAALAKGLGAAGLSDAVVIASHPAWVWRITGHRSVVLPDEGAPSILSVAKAYGATVVAADGVDGPWPDAAATTACLVPIDLPPDAGPMTAFRVVCTGP